MNRTAVLRTIVVDGPLVAAAVAIATGVLGITIGLALLSAPTVAPLRSAAAIMGGTVLLPVGVAIWLFPWSILATAIGGEPDA